MHEAVARGFAELSGDPYISLHGEKQGADPATDTELSLRNRGYVMRESAAQKTAFNGLRPLRITQKPLTTCNHARAELRLPSNVGVAPTGVASCTCACQWRVPTQLKPMPTPSRSN